MLTVHPPILTLLNEMTSHCHKKPVIKGQLDRVALTTWSLLYIYYFELRASNIGSNGDRQCTHAPVEQQSRSQAQYLPRYSVYHIGVEHL